MRWLACLAWRVVWGVEIGVDQIQFPTDSEASRFIQRIRASEARSEGGRPLSRSTEPKNAITPTEQTGRAGEREGMSGEGDKAVEVAAAGVASLSLDGALYGSNRS